MRGGGLVALPLVISLAAAPAVFADAGCVGRFVLARSTGTVLAMPDDVIVLDAAGVVIDPACGSATARTHGVRLSARWNGCRGHRVLKLKLRESSDCTVLRGTVSAPRAHASRFVALASRCGDGIRDAGRGERCDDGNLIAGDGCDATCGSCVDPATLHSTWAAIQANVFDHSCTACHGEQPTAGLDLRAPQSYADVVGVPAALGRFEIDPGDHTQSLLWLKMAKSALGGLDDLPGGAMPFGSALPADVVVAFGVWIDAGAPADGFVPGAEALLVPCP